MAMEPPCGGSATRLILPVTRGPETAALEGVKYAIITEGYLVLARRRIFLFISSYRMSDAGDFGGECCGSRNGAVEINRGPDLAVEITRCVDLCQRWGLTKP